MSDILEQARELSIRNSAVRDLWKAYGGRQHGPHVEHFVIPETGFWEFIDAVFALSEPKWLPIESAPKDGTRIMLSEAGGFVSTGHWSTTVWNLPGEWIVEEHRSDATVLEPTLWLPLPPKEEQ